MAHKGKHDLWFLVIKSNTKEFHYILMVKVLHNVRFLQKLFNGKDLLVAITYRLNIIGWWLQNASFISMIWNIGYINRPPMYCGQLWIRHMFCGRTCDELYHFTFCTDRFGIPSGSQPIKLP